MNRRSLNVFLAGVALAFPLAVPAATYVVNKIGDSNDGTCDADCSLREAVAAAVASADDDVIEFDPVVFAAPRTITLSGTEIVIAANGRLDIIGPGADLLTVSGNNASRIIANTANAVTTLSGIRFTEGNGVGAANNGRGGALYNVGGNLTLDRVIVTGNTSKLGGGGINNAGSSVPTVPGTLTINESLFSDNTSALSGGAIQNFSPSVLTIRNSAFVGNTADSENGGGAAQFNGSVTVSNSTFSGNAAPNGSGGAIQANGPLVLLANVTISANTSLHNGTGLQQTFGTAHVFLRNTIIAGNFGAGNSPDVTHTTNGLTSLGHNLIGVVGTSAPWIGSDLLNQDPGLDSLADNGGFTPTHALLGGSAAIDAGDDCVLDQSCATQNPGADLDIDQRGRSRPLGEAVDIGAFEFDPDADIIFADGFEGD